MAGVKGGNRKSHEAIVQARERERQVLELFLRGLNWAQIGRQLGMSDRGAMKAFDRAFKRLPAKDVEKLRALQSERLNDARRRVYTELAGRQEPDPDNPGQMRTVRLSPDEVFRGVDRIVRIEERDATLLGLDAPKKAEVIGALIRQPITDEEMDIQLGRLTQKERDTLMTIVAKMQNRWTAPPGIEDQGETVETTATNVESKGGGEEPDDGAKND
jgi:FixJ family two-component response regulator